MNVERLALVNEGSSIRRHINQHSLLDFPHCLVQIFQTLRYIQLLAVRNKRDYSKLPLRDMLIDAIVFVHSRDRLRNS